MQDYIEISPEELEERADFYVEERVKSLKARGGLSTAYYKSEDALRQAIRESY